VTFGSSYQEFPATPQVERTGRESSLGRDCLVFVRIVALPEAEVKVRANLDFGFEKHNTPGNKPVIKTAKGLAAVRQM
jgi:hypothetical protein